MSENIEATNNKPSNQSLAGEDIKSESTSPSNDWRDSLPEDLRSDKSFESINTIEDLAKSYKSAQSMIGNRIPIPSKEASKEVRDEFYKKVTGMPGVIRLPEEGSPEFDVELSKVYDKLGRPESPDKYKFEIPEELKEFADNDYLNEVRSVAHKAGLSQAQLKALSDIHLRQEQKVRQVMNDHKEAVRGFLKKEWGNAFEENASNYKGLLSKYETKYPEAVQELKSGVAGNNPVVLMMAAELGKIYKENGTISPNAGKAGSMTPDLAKERIAEILGNKQHAYYNYNDPTHEQAVQKVNKLYEDAYPTLDNDQNSY